MRVYDRAQRTVLQLVALRKRVFQQTQVFSIPGVTNSKGHVMERRKFIGSFPLAVSGALAIVATESRAQAQSTNGFLSVMDFGAVGDGVTDDG